MPPVSRATQQILDVLHEGGYIATADPEAALAALKEHDRGAVAANIHRLNVVVFNPGDIADFLNWVYNGGLTAAELERRSGVVLAMGAREFLASRGIALSDAGLEFLGPDPCDPIWNDIALVMGMVVPSWRMRALVDDGRLVFKGLDGQDIFVGNDGTTLWTIHRGYERNGYFPQVPNWRAEWERLRDLVGRVSPDLTDVEYGGGGIQSPEKVVDVFNLARSQIRLHFGKELSGTDDHPVNAQMHHLLSELDSVLLSATTGSHTLTYQQAHRAEHFLMVLHNAIRPREDEFDRARRAMQHVLQLINPPEIRVADVAKPERPFETVSDRVKSLTNFWVLRVMTEHDFNVSGTTADGEGWTFAYTEPATEAVQLGALGAGKLLMEPATPEPWGKEGDRAAVLYRGEYPREWGDYARRSSQGWEYPFAITVKNGKPWFAFYIDESKIGTGNDPAVTVDHLTWPEDFKLPDPYGAAGGEGGDLFARPETDLIAAATASVKRARTTDAFRLAAAVSDLGDGDWHEVMVASLLALEKKYDAAQTPADGSSTGDGLPPLQVYAKVTVRDPAAVYDVTYGEDAEYEVKKGVYDSKLIEFNQALGDLPGMESLDDTLLHILRTDERLKPLLKEVSRVRVNERGLTEPSIYEPGHYVFAVTYDGHLVNLTEDRRYWGYNFPLAVTRTSQRLSSAITTMAAKAGLTVTSGEFSTGFGRSRQRHHAVLVSDGADAPIAQITFHQTADGKVVVFLDQASRFGMGLMAPNMYNNFFVKLFDVIPRGTLVRGSYRFAGGDPNFGVWHWPEGAEFPQQYFPAGGYYLYPSPSRREGLSAPYEAKGGKESGSLADVTLSPSPRVEEGGREGKGEPKALAQSTVVGRQPTGLNHGLVEADQRVHPVMLRGGEIVAGGAPFDGNTALEFDTSIIAEPEVVLDPQPRLRLVESEQPTDDSTIKQLLASDTSPVANDNVEAPDDSFPPAGNTFHTIGASRIGVHGTAAVRLMAIP